INKLALNFRATTSTSPLVVATLAPGVQQDSSGGISLAGNLPYMTSFSVDGVSVQNTRGGGPQRDLLPSVESIGEFKVTSAGNNADFMQACGGLSKRRDRRSCRRMRTARAICRAWHDR